MDRHEPAVAPIVLEALRTLTVAWGTVGTYPAGHPRSQQATAAAQDVLAEATRIHGELVIGVEPQALLVGPARVTTPYGRRLAEALHDRAVAVLRIEPRVTPAEVAALLSCLATAVGPAPPAPLGPALAERGVTRIQVVPLDYTQIRLAADVDVERDDGATLLGRLVRLLMERGGGVTGHGPGSASGGMTGADAERWPASLEEVAAVIARIVSAGAGEPADEAAAGLIAEVAQAVRQCVDGSVGLARRLTLDHTATLVRALPETVRSQVLGGALRALGPGAGPAELAALVDRLGADLVLGTLQALLAEGVTLSPHSLMLLDGLGTRPGTVLDGDTRDETTMAGFRELSALLAIEDIDRYNPPDYQVRLEQTALALPVSTPVGLGDLAALGDRFESLDEDHVAQSLAHALLELAEPPEASSAANGVLGRIEELFRQVVSRGRMTPALTLVEGLAALVVAEAPAEVRAVRQAALARLGTVEVLADLVAGRIHGGAAGRTEVQRLLTLLGTEALRGLLQLLAEEPNRARRRHTFDLLASAGAAVVPHARALLGDPRWYVVRNGLALLRAVGDRSTFEEIRPLASGPDGRLRLEALRSLVALDAPGGSELLARALGDSDPKVAEAAAALAAQHPSTAIVEPLLSLVTGWGRSRHLPIRLAALRALGAVGDPAVLPRLRRVLGQGLWARAPIEEQREAFRALEGYPPAAREPWLRRGRGSRDAEIRHICARLGRSE